MKKSLLLPGLAALVFTGAVLISTVSVSAQETNGQATLVQKIAQKFGLQESEVQTVFDEHREEHHAQMQAHFEERLTQAVNDGKITEAQKQAIIAKHKKLQEAFTSERETMKNMTPEERKATMEKRHDALKAWAEEQGIDLSLFPMVMNGHGGHGMKIKMWADK
jgi:hypothetical protein